MAPPPGLLSCLLRRVAGPNLGAVALCCRCEPASVSLLGPFLHFLYCEPQRRSQHLLLRRSLLKVLLPTAPPTPAALQDQEQGQSSSVADALLACFCRMLPYMQVALAFACYR